MYFFECVIPSIATYQSARCEGRLSPILRLAKSQQSVKTSFGKVVCELKAAELDCLSSVPKTGLYRQGIQAVSIKLKSLFIKMPTRIVLTRVVPTRVVVT
jgi:hypothetical protein